MSLSVTPTGQLSIIAAILAIAVATSACRRTPNAEEGHRRLTGHYTYADLRSGYGTVINPDFKSASLELHADGTASQTCEFKDGKRYQSSGATWRYDGDGTISIRPLKDCSWVYGDRNTALEMPATGASLIVEWGSKPVIVMHPDHNAFYEHR